MLSYQRNIRVHNFFTVTQVHQRTLAIESRSKESQETHRHHRSSMHALECNSDCSDDESKNIYTAEFIWSFQAKSFTCSTLSQFTKIGKKRNLLLMYPSARKYLLICTRMDILRCLILYCN